MEFGFGLGCIRFHGRDGPYSVAGYTLAVQYRHVVIFNRRFYPREIFDR